MISSMSPFTIFHVVLSLVGIFSGFVVVIGFLTLTRLDGWNAVFLVTTLLTSITGFLFPVHRFMPSHVFGILTLILMAVAIFARYRRHLEGGWRRSYAISSVIALYLNVFILIVQLYEKVPALKAIAPTQTESPFKITQLANLVLFIALGILSSLRFRSEQFRTA